MGDTAPVKQALFCWGDCQCSLLIDNLCLPLLEKSRKSQRISCGLENVHTVEGILHRVCQSFSRV